MTLIKNFIFSTKYQLIILLFVAIGLNLNTLLNEYAVDDEIVLTKNSFVTKGIKGIPEIISQSYFKGFDNGEGREFSGGRYRPLALVIFAFEYQFFGTSPAVSHLINILLFATLIALLYKLLQAYVFRKQHEYLAFVTCLLFAIHPIHTEVIANVKSRDELITFLLLIVSLISFIKHIERKKLWLLPTGLFCFFLALLTRESSVTFIGVVPLVVYFFFNQSVKKSILFSIPLIVVFGCYLLLRYLIVGINQSNISDVINAPFLYATASQAFATKVFVLFKYIGLLVLPHPLSWEYGYNQIPYIEVFSIKFLLSLLFLIGLIAYAIFTFNKKSLFSFAILYFFFTISLVSNFLIDTGTPLSERLLFQPSLAFCMVIAALYIKVNEKAHFLTTAVFFVIIILFSAKSYLRNSEWKNNETLYLSDVNSSPNSIRTNSAATYVYLSKANVETNKELKKDYFKKAVFYAERSLKIYPQNKRTYNDLIAAYVGLFNYYPSAGLFLKDNNLNPSLPKTKNIIDVLSTVFYKQGNGFYEQSNIDAAIESYLKCIELNDSHIEAWYNLGGNYFLKNDTINAIKSWEKVKTLDPAHTLKKDEFSL